jgi:hypothetical protein
VPDHALPANALVPNGIPIGQSLALPTEATATAEAVRSAVAALDRVMADGAMAKIAVRIVADTQDEGGHEWRVGIGSIEIVIAATTPIPGMTMLHEIGHRLDVEGLGQKRGYGSQPVPRLSRGTYLVLDWWRAIQGSDAYSLIQRLKITDSAEKSHLKYLLTPPEVFARSFAQYIVLRSGNPQLAAELDLLRDPANHPGVYYPYQWAYDDFEPIATAFDQMFYRLGWLRRL